MSKYNLFAERAGFRFVKPMRSNKYEAGIAFFHEVFDSHPANTAALIAEISARLDQRGIPIAVTTPSGPCRSDG